MILERCLIGLDKCPGVRPIGIGEVLRRILGKVMVLVTGPYDVEILCRADQLCSGLRYGIEGAIQGMREMFDDSMNDGSGMLLVDAKNSVTRVAAIWNARVLWPCASRFIFNTYQGFSFLVIKGSSEFILSKEGVIQGDPLSMLLYSIALLRLIRSLADHSKWHQAWYTDDSACIGSFEYLKEWFSMLSDMGSAFGYYAEPRKSFLIVGPDDVSEAERIFGNLGIKIVTGCHYLGGFIGNGSNIDELLQQKISVWEDCLVQLAKAAKSQPQASFAALSKSLQFEWNFVSRVIPNCGGTFSSIRNLINYT